MVWLITHIWFSLGLAAFFGLLFGWAFRGLHLKGRAREALVQRDIALTELEQSRLEIDQLYAAQRKGIGAASEAGDESLRVELEAREEKLQALSKELADSQDELAELKTKAVAAAGAGAVVVGALATDSDDGTQEAAPEVERLDDGLNLGDASLEWRNRYLASRVRSLEVAGNRADEAEKALDAFKTEAEENQAQAIAAALAASTATAAVAARANDVPVDAASAEDAVSTEKQAWQNEYLRRRLAFMEGSAVSAAPATPIAETEIAEIAATEADTPSIEQQADEEKAAWKAAYLAQRISYLENHPPRERGRIANDDADHEQEIREDQSSIDDQMSDEPAAVAHQGTLEQELARLRWRNRYLEGRLAYIDGDVPAGEADEVDKVASEALGQPEEKLAQQTPESIAHADSTEKSDPTPAEAVLAALNASGDSRIEETEAGKPDELRSPVDGGDDLTRIDGVDQAAAGALNALGIWHFHQIAGWSAENADWVNAHLESEGRVEAEDWIAQAGSLSVGANLS